MAAVANKRKREAGDLPTARTAPGMASSDFDQHYLQTDDDGLDHNDANMEFAAALAQHNAGIDDAADRAHEHGTDQNQGGQHDGQGQSASDTAAAAMAQYHTMTVPQSTESAFMAHSGDGERPDSSAMDTSRPGQRQSFSDFDINLKDGQQASNGDSPPAMGDASHSNSTPKPQVGTDAWHKVRRDNHKEVERRRRETINEGINELAKIVPGCEKNKGSILARAVQFITQLKDNESTNIEKWTLEKLLTEQAIAELSSSCDKLKAECQRAWSECEQWKKAAQKAGVRDIDFDEKVMPNDDDRD